MEGRRLEKKEEGGGKKLPWIITGAVAGTLAAAYLGLCAWAVSRDTILPNVSVAGVDVSNLTLAQAESAVRTAFEQRGGDIKLTLVYEGLEESMDASQLTYTPGLVEEAFALGHEQFLQSGYQLAGHMLGMSSQVPMGLPKDEPALRDLMERMERAVAGSTADHGYQVEGDKLVMTKGAPVVTVDWDTVEKDAREALQEGFQEALGGGGGPVEKRVVLAASRSQTERPDFEAIHRAVYVEPVNAQMDPETFEVTGHTVGVDFDVAALETAYSQAAEGETFSVPLTVTQPKDTKESLEGKLFRDLLGEGTTTVSGSSNRKYNVKLSAEACNNVILLPGQEFSYNNTTGSRSADKGYRNAPIYKAGQSVDDIGGGICQTSSTIYYAVLHTNLEVVERHCHQFNTGYVDLGMDATVFYGSLDFRFKNNTDYPVKIVTNSYDSNGKRYLNVKLYGTNPEGIYAVPKSSTFDRVAPTTVYAPDPSVPQGTLVLDREQYAYTGWSAHTYRYIYDKDGNEIDKQDMGGSKYKMRPNTYHYNPADGDPATWPNGTPPQPGGTTSPVDPGVTTPPSDSGITPIDPGTGEPANPGTPDDPPVEPSVPENPVTPPVTPEPDPGLDARPGPEAGGAQ